MELSLLYALEIVKISIGDGPKGHEAYLLVM